MKFGKKIVSMAKSSTALCPPEDWMHYKHLKKLLHDVQANQALNPPKEGDKVGKKRTESIEECKYEKVFFSFLKQELRKVTLTFCKLETKLFQRFRDFLPRLNALKKSYELKLRNPSEKVSAVIEECAELHFLFVCLESYAVINYAGFTKILKKHDKITGFTTRDKYMLKLVDDKPFAQHKRIKAALNAVTLGRLKPSHLKSVIISF